MTKWYEGAMTHTISVSQINSFANLHDPKLWSGDSCPRKWALMSIAKVPYQPNKHLEFGLKTHEAVEDSFSMPHDDWCKKWPPEYTPDTEKYGAVAQAMLRHSDPCPKPIIEPTWFWEIPELDVAVYIKPDIVHPDHTWFGDWKTTGAKDCQGRFVLQQPEFWPILNAAGERPPKIKMLMDDVQPLVYSHHLMEMKGLKSIRAQWIYCTKKFKHYEKPNAWAVRYRFERLSVQEVIERDVLPIIELMVGLRKTLRKKNVDDALLVPHNPNACGHRGRMCDALAQCNFKDSKIKLVEMRKVLGR